MRICPRCNERYDDASRFCPHDGEPLPVDEADARIGTTLLDQFELLEVCGKGAMGTVYRAWQTGMERQVAIKVLRPELLRDPKTVARFDREARAVAKLQHPNIVTFFLVGHTDDGLPFLAMEYVEGASLAAVAEHQGILPVPRALHIARQITSALSEAHAEGIVHRDLKPANILLTDRRRMPDFVKVLDFGIAKILGGEVDAKEDLESRLTRTGAIFGTPHYIAPEQAQGGEIDHRADLYSLGVLLYRLLTGRLPFDGTGINVLLAHIGQPVTPPGEISPGFDPRLEALIMRALEKDPADRFQSAEEMGDALELLGAVRTTGSRSDEALAATAALEPSDPEGEIPITVASGSQPRRPSPGGGSAAVASPPITGEAMASSPPAGYSELPVRASRRGTFLATVAVLVLLAGSAAGGVWLLNRDEPVAAAPPASPSPVAVPAPPPSPSKSPAPEPAPSGPAAPGPEMRTVTLGEEGYAIRAQVPRDPRVGVDYTLVFDVLDPSGAPLQVAGLPMSIEDPDDHENDVDAPAVSPGHYQLRRAFDKPGRNHVHVFPDTSTKKLHIWFDLLVKDADGHLPEPKVAQRPPRARPTVPAPVQAPAPTPTPTPAPAPAPTPPVVEDKPPSEPTAEVHEGVGASDPYHDPVIRDDELKDPPAQDKIEPPVIKQQPPRIRWRFPRPRKQRPNPDGLE